MTTARVPIKSVSEEELNALPRTTRWRAEKRGCITRNYHVRFANVRVFATPSFEGESEGIYKLHGPIRSSVKVKKNSGFDSRRDPMNQSDLKQWIRSHFGEGKWLEFIAHLNAVREQKQLKPLSVAAISNWLHTTGRNPPTWVAAYLPIIEARLKNPEQSHQISVVHSFSQKEWKSIERAARRASCSIEQFVVIQARIALEDELGWE